MCGLCSSFPDCTASVNIRFRIVSSRLISAFETPSISRVRSGIRRLVPSLRVISRAFVVTVVSALDRRTTRFKRACAELNGGGNSRP